MKKTGLLLIPIITSFVYGCEKPKPDPQPTEEHTLTLTFDKCTVDGQTTYSHTYIKGERIEPVVVAPINHCFLDENSVPDGYKNYWKKGAAGSWVLLNLVINEDNAFKITATNREQYGIEVDEASFRLSFTTVNDQSLDKATLYEGEDFKFKMKVLSSNTNEYKVPTALDIYVGDSTVELSSKNYSIDDIDESGVEATVTIFGTSVTDDIRIKGEAVLIQYYKIKLDNYGVSYEEWEGFPDALAKEDKVITFTQQSSYELPGADNIYLCFDNSKKWISPSQSETSTYCQYDENKHQLTIKATKVKSNLQIKVRSPRYNILDFFTWKEINDYSVSGNAPYLFYVGEVKTVSIDDDTYDIRIIDFNRDVDRYGNKIGITFEFANVIKNFSESWDKEIYARLNHDFCRSTLNQQFQPGNDGKEDGKIYQLVDKITDSSSGDKLTSFIKTAKKEIEIYTVNDGWDSKTYNTKLFPLSRHELDGDYTSYQYYKNARSERRRKDDTAYWLRSPSTDYDNYSWYVSAIGALSDYGDIYNDTHTVAPAFCI